MDNELSLMIGQRINERLAVTGMKQKELAQNLGIPDNTVSYFCSGRRMPNTAQIKRIAVLLDCSADYLLGLTDTATNDKDMQFICKYTGLNESAVETLNDLSEPTNIFRCVPREMLDTLNFLINDLSLELLSDDLGCRYRKGILGRLTDYLSYVSNDNDQYIYIATDGKMFNSEEEAIEANKKIHNNSSVLRAKSADLVKSAFINAVTDAAKDAKERYTGTPHGDDQETQ